MKVAPRGVTMLATAAALLLIGGFVASRQGVPFVPRQVIDQINGRISVTGRVVDQNGERLSGVTMEVSKIGVTSNLAHFMREEESTFTVDGVFEVACADCASIDLRFLKVGYYVGSYACSLGDPDGTRERQLACNDVAIVLELVPRAVQVVHRRGELRFDRSGAKQVVTLGGHRTGSVTPGPQKTLASLSPPYAYLVCDTQSDGTLSRRTVPEPQREGLTLTAPGGARLVFSDSGDGVVLYEPRTDSPSPSMVFREMREAPASGYQNELRFDQVTEVKRLYYFYCTIGGWFGKGYVSIPRFSDKRSLDEAVANMEIQLNPDGSRDVTTHF